MSQQIDSIIPRGGTPSPPLISAGTAFSDMLTVSGEISVDTLGAPSPISAAEMSRRLGVLTIPARMGGSDADDRRPPPSEQETRRAVKLVELNMGGDGVAERSAAALGASRSSPMATALQARKSLRKGGVSSATCSSPQATALQRRKMRKHDATNSAGSGGLSADTADIMRAHAGATRAEASSPQATALQRRKSGKSALLRASGGLSAAAVAIVGAHSGACRAEASSPQATALQRRKQAHSRFSRTASSSGEPAEVATGDELSVERESAHSPFATELQQRKQDRKFGEPGGANPAYSSPFDSNLRARKQMRPRLVDTAPPAPPLLDDGGGAGD